MRSELWPHSASGCSYSASGENEMRSELWHSGKDVQGVNTSVFVRAGPVLGHFSDNSSQIACCN